MSAKPSWLSPTMGTLLAVTIGCCLAAFVVVPRSAERPYDSTDKPPARPGVSVVVDELTGCHYLRTPVGGLAPRLGADGKPLCGAEVPR